MLGLLTRFLSPALGAALVLALAWGAWQTYGKSVAEAATASVRAEFSQYRETAVNQAAAELTKRIAEDQRSKLKLMEALDAEHIQSQANRADLVRARAASVSLQQRADELAAAADSACQSNPAATLGSTPADTPGAVLGGMLKRIDEAATQLAEFADQTGAARELCQRAYESLIPEITKETP